MDDQRWERIERTMVSEHEDLRRAQDRTQKNIDELFAAGRHTDERLNALIGFVDRSNPRTN